MSTDMPFDMHGRDFGTRKVQDRGCRTAVCPPKTETSVRTLALDHGLVAALRALRSQRRAQGGEPVGFLFTDR